MSTFLFWFSPKYVSTFIFQPIKMFFKVKNDILLMCNVMIALLLIYIHFERWHLICYGDSSFYFNRYVSCLNKRLTKSYHILLYYRNTPIVNIYFMFKTRKHIHWNIIRAISIISAKAYSPPPPTPTLSLFMSLTFFRLHNILPIRSISHHLNLSHFNFRFFYKSFLLFTNKAWFFSIYGTMYMHKILSFTLWFC